MQFKFNYVKALKGLIKTWANTQGYVNALGLPSYILLNETFTSDLARLLNRVSLECQLMTGNIHASKDSQGLYRRLHDSIDIHSAPPHPYLNFAFPMNSITPLPTILFGCSLPIDEAKEESALDPSIRAFIFLAKQMSRNHPPLIPGEEDEHERRLRKVRSI
jgi:hypothetical protein